MATEPCIDPGTPGLRGPGGVQVVVEQTRDGAVIFVGVAVLGGMAPDEVVQVPPVAPVPGVEQVSLAQFA
ncbi:hypothetical protein [Nonomuraea sp. B5E05]|uniref:hypothetical protein n=1 Tax=Nonomuraea sp. B5E05 TaxID=3153569 RepID=UPI003260FB2A